jgi:FkbM family methyltransferase
MKFRLHKKIATLLKIELIKRKKHPTASSHIMNLINHYDIDLVLDVGANNGGFGKMLRLEGYKGTIHSFEPVSKTYEELKKVIAKDSNWHAHQYALGATQAKQLINVTESSDLASFLSPSSFGKDVYKENLKTSHQEEVIINTVDQFLSKEIHDMRTKKVFLKMDTQGFDMQVIQGSLKSLDSISCVLSEISLNPIYSNMPHYLDSLKSYEELGLMVTGLYPVSREKDLSIIEMDCMLINKIS